MTAIKKRCRKIKQTKIISVCRSNIYVNKSPTLIKPFCTQPELFLDENKRYRMNINSSEVDHTMRLKGCIDSFCKDAKIRIMKSTFQKYECQLDYLYLSPLANVRMSELKGIKIVEWINWLKKHPTSRNKYRKTFIHELKLLSTILNWYKNFLNESFVVPITKKHRQMCFFKQNAPRRPDYYIQPEDARRWVEWLRANKRNAVYWRLATFMLSTGARVSEACGLRWAEIDLEKGMARVIRRVRWDHFSRHPFLEDVTKTTQSSRLLMLPTPLIDILMEIKKSAISNLVFTDRRGGLLKYNAVQSAFNAGFVALDLPWRSTHICRHTYATVALMTTKNLSVVQATLGHAEMRMTQRYAKTVALLNHEAGEKTFSALFKK